MNNSGSHVMPLSSALSSNPAGTHSTQWKSNQAIPPLSGGIYNLTRTNSPGPGQIPTMVTSPGLHMPLSNGNAITPHSSSGHHGMGMGGMAQSLAGMQGAPGLHSQKLGVNPAVNGRGLSGPQSLPSVQRSQHSGSMPVSAAMGSLAASQIRPPVPPPSSGALPSSTTALGVTSVPYQGGSAPGLSHSTPLSMPLSGPMLLNGGQVCLYYD